MSQAWRRMNKKLRHLEGGPKRKTRKAAKVQKAILGLSLEDINKKKTTIRRTVPGAKAAALKEARARQSARPEAAKAEKPKAAKVPVQKVAQRQPRVSKQAGARR